MVLKPLAFSVSVLALVIVAVVTLFIIHPLVALLGIVLFPLLVVMSQIYTSRVEAPSARAQQAVGEVASVAHESFEGALVVKTLGREAAEVDGCAARRPPSGRNAWSSVGSERRSSRASMPCPTSVSSCCCSSAAGWSRAVTPPLATSSWPLSCSACSPRRFGSSASFSRRCRAVVALDRADKVMAQPVEQRAGTATVPAGPVDVAVHGLVVGYGEHHVLQGVDLEVAAGTTAAVVGATGSGKSTLLEAVAGVLDRIEGTVAIGGSTS